MKLLFLLPFLIFSSNISAQEEFDEHEQHRENHINCAQETDVDVASSETAPRGSERTALEVCLESRGVPLSPRHDRYSYNPRSR